MVNGRGWFTLTCGVLGVVLGAVWTLQGLGHLGGSLMTGVTLWAVVGPIVALAGLTAIVIGLRRRNRQG